MYAGLEGNEGKGRKHGNIEQTVIPNVLVILSNCGFQ
jgi:hypothetical protein